MFYFIINFSGLSLFSIILFFKIKEWKYSKKRKLEEKYIAHLINEHYNKDLIILEIKKNNFSVEYFKSKYNLLF